MGAKATAGRAINRLSARRVETEKRPGRHSDGNNLYLIVDPSGSKRWAFIYRWKRPGEAGAGRLREMGLGSTRAVDLKAARERASEALKLLANGQDPIEARNRLRERPSFGEVADQWMADRAPGLRSDKSVARHRRALEIHAASIRSLRVDNVATEDVLAVLKPIWIEKAETAKMVRGYIEQVLNAAKAKGWRTGENPARWSGHLDHLLPRIPKLRRGHHKALPYHEVPALIASLRLREATAARALEFLILTAARSGEVREARWTEIDLKSGTWTISAARMKSDREHRVPLSPRAAEILEEMAALRTSPDAFVFPGQKPGRPLSNMAFKKLMERLDVTEATTHGFRSAFRDWAGDATAYPRELAEQALAHRIGDQAEQAYRRGDALEKRRLMMAEWALFCRRAPSAANDQAASLSSVPAADRDAR